MKYNRSVDILDSDSSFETFFKRHLKNDVLLSKMLGDAFRHIPQSTIIKENRNGPLYQRRQTWDVVTDNLFFSPIAYSSIICDEQILKKCNLSSLLLVEHILEIYGNDLDIKAGDWIATEPNAEALCYLSPPIYERTLQAEFDKQVCMQVKEIVSTTPNKNRGISILDYLSPKKEIDPNLARRLDNTLCHIKDFLDINQKHILASLLPTVPEKERAIIEELIDGVEHIAFILAPGIEMGALDDLLTNSGFHRNHQIFPSFIFSKELGALVHQPEIKTHIVKAWGLSRHQREVGVELFIPEAHPNLVKHWIRDDIGSHLAFKMKTSEACEEIRHILAQFNIQPPNFMNGTPMKNPVERSIVQYFDVSAHGHKFRLEFFHKE